MNRIESQILGLVEDNFQFLVNDGFVFRLNRDHPPTNIWIDAIAEKIAIRFDFEIRDRRFDCYVFPVIDGSLDDTYLGPSTYGWLVDSYCTQVLKVNKHLKSTIVKRLSSDSDPLDLTLKYYKFYLAEIDLKQLKLAKFPKGKHKT